MNSAKDYLLQIRLLDMRLKTIDETIKRIRGELQSIGDISVRSSWPDGQPHGTMTTDPTGTQAVKLADANNAKREELVEELKRYESDQIIVRSKLWAKQIEVLSVLDKVPDPTCHRLLVLRYVKGYTWERIAVDLDKTYQWVAGPLHGRALVMVEEIITECQINSAEVVTDAK